LTLFLGCSRPLASQENAGVWLDVPFVKQEKDGCGSAVVSMVLQYWNERGAGIANRADPKTIQKQLYTPTLRGIRASDMERYLKESGFRVFPLDGKWGDLEEQLRQGRPVIVSVQPDGAGHPLHYAVVTGMDWEKDAVFLHDPARGKLLRIERAEFEREWRANRNWMLLAVPEKAT
jgi:ABC-type bacteriocin/lantibiotic exporter with double-glycine peptidase domain